MVSKLIWRFARNIGYRPMIVALINGLLIIVISVVLLHFGLLPYARHSMVLESYNYPYDTVNTGLITYTMGKGLYSIKLHSEASMNVSIGCIMADGEPLYYVNKTLDYGSDIFERVRCDVAAFIYYEAYVPRGITVIGNVEVVKGWP